MMLIFYAKLFSILNYFICLDIICVERGLSPWILKKYMYGMITSCLLVALLFVVLPYAQTREYLKSVSDANQHTFL